MKKKYVLFFGSQELLINLLIISANHLQSLTITPQFKGNLTDLIMTHTSFAHFYDVIFALIIAISELIEICIFYGT